MAKVLVIDDDPGIREVVAEILEVGGHQAFVAKDGFDGVRVFRTEHPDVVITDIVMPGKEGIETILELRREEPTARIIAISGDPRAYGPTGYLAFAQKLGADKVQPKPFTATDLLQLIDDLL